MSVTLFWVSPIRLMSSSTSPWYDTLTLGLYLCIGDCSDNTHQRVELVTCFNGVGNVSRFLLLRTLNRVQDEYLEPGLGPM